MNGFVRQQLDLTGQQPHLHRFKHCDKCEETRPPEGGIQMSPNRWYCAGCWALKATRRPKLAKT